MSNKGESLYKHHGPYQAYLEGAPPDPPEPTRNNQNQLIIVSGELRCRMKGCLLNQSLFANEGNLRKHYPKAHGEAVEEHKNGAITAAHNQDVHEFYRRLMAGEPLEPIPRKPRHRGLTPPPHNRVAKQGNPQGIVAGADRSSRAMELL